MIKDTVTFCEDLIASAEATRLGIEKDIPAMQSHIRDAILWEEMEDSKSAEVSRRMDYLGALRKARNQRFQQLVAVNAEIQTLRGLLDSPMEKGGCHNGDQNCV